MSRWKTMVALAAAVCVLTLGVGCERKPVVEEDEGEEVTAPEVETTTETTPETVVTPETIAPAPAAPGTLFDFETDDDVAAWKVEDEIKDQVVLSVARDKATTGKRSLKMVLKTGDWPGMHTFKVPKDWSAYSELKFDVIADQDAELAIRIDDVDSTDYGSRFNMGGLAVNKGKNTVTVDVVDVGDAIDLKKVKAIFLFSSGVTDDLTFYLDNIRLAK